MQDDVAAKRRQRIWRNQLKLTAADGKSYLTDVANAETLLRLVQSVPSPRAEPIKLWLAKVGYERMQDMSDPARALERARATWQKHGRSEKWIQQRMTGQETSVVKRSCFVALRETGWEMVACAERGTRSGRPGSGLDSG